MPFHNRTQRWACLVAHRRAGKTVAALNDLLRAAITCQTPGGGLYGFISPYRSQAKSTAWNYLKRFSEPIAASSNESELTVTLVNGSIIRLFGADNADAIRGLGFHQVVADEFADWRPSVFPLVVRPALSDYQGGCTFLGTPKGHNAFYEVYKRALRSPEWFCMTLPADKSGILPPTELEAARAQLTDDQFRQEYLCDFESAILGAFYGIEMRQAAEQGRIRDVPYEPSLPVHTAFDLGWKDDTAIWWYQVIRGEIHVLDYYAVSGATVPELAQVITDKPYRYGKHHLPHDARAKTLASGGKSIIEQLAEFLGVNSLRIVPDIGLQNGIQAVRRMLPRCWFHVERCADGIEALKQYQREYDEDKKAFRATPAHNWCFVGETKVLTRSGTYQMMSLPYSGEVLTSCGWKQYINPRITRKNASLVEVRFESGYTVRCTPDHLFKTVNGWISAESLQAGMQIQSALTPSRSILMAVCTVFGKVKSTLQEAGNTFIEKFGAMPLAQFQTGATSITKTPTVTTTSWKIWNACRPQFTFEKRSPGNQNEFLVKTLEMQRRLGINLKKAGCGTNDKPNEARAGQNGSASIKTVLNAGRVLTLLCEKAAILSCTVRQIARLRHIAKEAAKRWRLPVIESVCSLEINSDVWCMTVPEAEEFSLANGAIVHNCSHPADAFRMLAVAWEEEPKASIPVQEKVLIVGPQNEVTMNDMWAMHESQQPRRARL